MKGIRIRSFQPLFESFISLHYNLNQSATSNVHNSIHMVKVCDRFGDLPRLSSKPFENKLYKIKNLIRSGRNSLQQIANRLTEMMFANENCLFLDKWTDGETRYLLDKYREYIWTTTTK